ncbi:MAG: GNAT family N-acetyltransferase, partial [Nanoarchaeales archaeon]|nr:GNAT family N-acetyltransferase [Nanoarchaeales archaeon]
MRIRLFNKKLDSDYIISTFEDMYSSNPNFKYTREGFENFKKDINKYENNCDFGLIYVLEDEKRTELVGYMFISFRNGKINNKIIIEKLYIDQEHRNNGYSKLLVNKDKDVAKEKYIKF